MGGGGAGPLAPSRFAIELYYIRNDDTAKNRKLHKFATTNSNLEKKNFRYASSYIVQVYQFSGKYQAQQSVHTNLFAKNSKLHQSKPCTQIYLQNSSKLLQFATTILVTF